MELPNYFLADLPPEATLTPAMLTEACLTLKRNRLQYLAGCSTERVIRVIEGVAREWVEPQSRFRRLALERGPTELGFPRATLARGLDAFFAELTGEKLEIMVTAELGHRERLDDLVATSDEQRAGRAAIARGPELLVHITAGSIPVPGLMSLVLGLLVRSAQFVKCASGTALLPRLFAHSIYEAEPKFGACLEVADWTGGTEALEAAVFSEAECVTVTGSDATLAALRQRLPPHVRCLGYGHRVSFGYITREALGGFGVKRLIEDAATDVIAWNQLGCLSPHLFYVQTGGRVSPEQFAEMLAAELARREEVEPRGPVPTQTAALISIRRSFYEVRAAHSRETQLWCSPNSTAWTVVFEGNPTFQTSCLHRFVHVKVVANLTEALQESEKVRGKTSTVGLAAADAQAQGLARELAHWGATRICRIGQLQNPPLSWRHDGRPALGDLITWTDWEK